jgi:uncharacterized protein YndB with AHSA1/START domain
MTNTDRIEKDVVIRAPKARVWRALTDPAEFGTWFRVKLESAFVAGQAVTGQITHPGYEHVTFTAHVERIEPERYFSFRWRPYAIDPKVDYSKEPMTLVEFRLEGVAGGTRLSVTESGFDGIPKGRRAEAYRMNAQGWAIQMDNIHNHVAG